MKKIILIAIAFIGLQTVSHGQNKQGPNGKERGQKMMNLTAEEMATLQTKKMTLALDLSESQQDKIHKINLDNATKRKEMMAARKAKKESGDAEKPTKEERLEMVNAQLDHKIAMKAKMKDILDEEQYAKWEKMAQRKKGNKKGGGKKKQK